MSESTNSTATPNVDPGANPYVGPRTFTRDQAHLFFGRAREAEELFSRVVSQRLVLFYAQSGAGKSSLINTQLIPKLEATGFVVLPVGRVGGDLLGGVDDTVDNIYLFNLMLSLDQSQRDPARLAHLTLPHFLNRLTTDDGVTWFYDETDGEGTRGQDDRMTGRAEVPPTDTPLTIDNPSTALRTSSPFTIDNPSALLRTSSPSSPNYVLIIDQFEEIITTHGDRWQNRAEFFRQLEAAMVADPSLWVVLTLREDFVAALDPYAPLLSDNLRARYYMQRMGVEAARLAISQPAAARERPFQPAAVELLVNNLSQVRVAGKASTESGQYIEPVQLQVVCYQLWERLVTGGNNPGISKDSGIIPTPSTSGAITVTDVQNAGDVDSALASFYEATLAAALHASPLVGGERRLRHWFEEKLLTEAGTRGTVYQGDQETAGLPNALVLELANRFLLRSEARSGGRWVELTHDRFAEPIQAANRDWEAKQNNPLAAVTQLWLDNSRDPARLLKGQQLVDVQSYAAAHTETLTPLERDFLTVSVQREQADIAAAVEAATRRRTLLAVGLAALILFALLAFYGQNRASEANRQKATAQSQATDAAIAKATAVAASNSAATRAVESSNARATAVAESTRSAIAVVTAEAALKQTERQSQLALSRQLAAQSASELNNSRYEPSILLAIESGQITNTLEAFTAIRTAITHHWSSRTILQGHTSFINEGTWSQDESKILTASADGTVRIWDAASSQQLVKLEGHTDRINEATWNQDESKILTASDDRTACIWDAANGKELVKLEGHADGVWQAMWSKDERRILTVSTDFTVRIWHEASGQELVTLAGDISSATWSQDERKILTARDDGTVRVWDAIMGKELVKLSGDMDSVWQATWSQDESKILTVDYRTARVWDTASGQELVNLEGHTNHIWQATWSQDESKILTASSDGTARIWDAVTGKELVKLEEDMYTSVIQATWSKDESKILTASSDGRARIWDAVTGKELLTLESDRGSVDQATWSNDESKILTATGIWDATTGTDLVTLVGYTVRQATWSNDESKILTAGDDGTVRIWDAASGQELVKLTGHAAGVNQATWSKDERTVLTASDDGTVRIWDAASGQEWIRLEGGMDRAWQATWSQDESKILTTSADGTMRIWYVHMKDLAAWLPAARSQQPSCFIKRRLYLILLCHLRQP